MCITFAFFSGLVDREHQDPVCCSPVAQLVAAQRAVYFQMYQKDRLAHIDLCARAKSNLQQGGQCFCLAGIQAFELADLAVEVAVAQKLAQGELFGFGCSLVVECLPNMHKALG